MRRCSCRLVKAGQRFALATDVAFSRVRLLECSCRRLRAASQPRAAARPRQLLMVVHALLRAAQRRVGRQVVRWLTAHRCSPRQQRRRGVSCRLTNDHISQLIMTETCVDGLLELPADSLRARVARVFYTDRARRDYYHYTRKPSTSHYRVCAAASQTVSSEELVFP